MPKNSKTAKAGKKRTGSGASHPPKAGASRTKRENVVEVTRGASVSGKPKRKLRAQVEKLRPIAKAREPAPVVDAMSRPWRVAHEKLANASDAALKPILLDLIHAEASRAGCNVPDINVNPEDRAADGGADAMTPRPFRASPWLGDRETCWQFKVGEAGEPARLKGEVLKRWPSSTLKRGGRFVVLATGMTSGPEGRHARRDVLIAEAKRARLPTQQIEVYGADTVARWIEEHPGIAASLNAFPAGCSQMERWRTHPHHKSPWHPSVRSTEAIARYRRDLGPAGTGNPHLHIHGPAGAGKTRLALEICRDAAWRFDVLYVESKGATNVDQLIERLEVSAGTRAVVVVDEVEPEEARRWNALVLRAPDRLRLLTIGLRPPPDGFGILEHIVDPLVEKDVVALLRTTHVGLPDEHIKYAAQFSHGFPKLAQVTADALERDRTLDVRSLLERGDVRSLLNSLIGDSSRRQSLLVLAALEHVGWEGDAGAEGQAIAKHFELDWLKVREDVAQVHATQGIAPPAGDLRYISPRPLGVLLAVEAWQANPARMRTLYDKLPTEGARRAYEGRLRLISQFTDVEAFAATELAQFRSASELASESAVRRWSGFGHALPTLATRYVREALEQASVAFRQTIDAGARRHLVWGLVDYSRRADCFADALWALAHLAVAENETYANNATKEFVKRFQLVLGGTATPYVDRLLVLDEIIASSDPAYRALAVWALGRPLATSGEILFRGRSDEFETVPTEWRPRTEDDVHEALAGALVRLQEIAAHDAAAEVGEALVGVVSNAVMRLRNKNEREPLAKLITTLGSRDELVRERLWKSVEDVLSRTERYWKDRPAMDIEWLRSLLGKLDDPSLMGRVRRSVASRHTDDPTHALDNLAAEVVMRPDVWDALWTWLLGGEVGGGAWAMGEALGAADRDGVLLAPLEVAGPGPDLRALASYLRARGTKYPLWSIDDWLDKFASIHPNPTTIIELTARTCASTRSVDRVLHGVTAGGSSVATEHLSYGGWATALADVDFERLIRALAVSPPHRGSALTLLHYRSERDPPLISRLEDVVVSLVADPELVRRSPNHGFSWQHLANQLVPQHAARIGAAILAAQDPRMPGAGSWFLEHSTYPRGVLGQCIEIDASAVWNELRLYLENPEVAFVYAIGLPPLLERLPRSVVLDWITGDPTVRGALAVQMIAKVVDGDSLLLEVLERFSNVRDVADAARSEFFSGSWTGDASAHWERVADQLRPLAERTDKRRAARWARETIKQLETAAERDRHREAEARIRRR